MKKNYSDLYVKLIHNDDHSLTITKKHFKPTLNTLPIFANTLPLSAKLHRLLAIHLTTIANSWWRCCFCRKVSFSDGFRYYNLPTSVQYNLSLGDNKHCHTSRQTNQSEDLCTGETRRAEEQLHVINRRNFCNHYKWKCYRTDLYEP